MKGQNCQQEKDLLHLALFCGIMVANQLILTASTDLVD